LCAISVPPRLILRSTLIPRLERLRVHLGDDELLGEVLGADADLRGGRRGGDGGEDERGGERADDAHGSLRKSAGGGATGHSRRAAAGRQPSAR
jgi:hypothetical protein